jgi:hypothetical protein
VIAWWVNQEHKELYIHIDNHIVNLILNNKLIIKIKFLIIMIIMLITNIIILIVRIFNYKNKAYIIIEIEIINRIMWYSQ